MLTDDLSGSTLGLFELRRMIGIGGMGTVYQAYQISLQRDVAIKVLSRNIGAEADSNTRFTAEAKIAAGLEHPHIIPVYDYGTQQGISYIAMRWLTGGSLDTVLSRYKSLENIATLLEQLASALDYTHKQGVIHRDIKTANVLFDQFGIPYLTDFGIAKVLAETNALTTTGRIFGTPSYMAPELWRNEPASPASDIYALGILVFTLLAGNPPFQATTPYALMLKHIYESPLSTTSLPELIPEIIGVLNRALAKRPTDRHPTAGKFAIAFREAIQDKQPSVVVAPPTRQCDSDDVEHTFGVVVVCKSRNDTRNR